LFNNLLIDLFRFGLKYMTTLFHFYT